MNAAFAAPRQEFLDFVRAARFEEGIPAEDIQDASDPSLTFTLKLEGIWFKIEHFCDPMYSPQAPEHRQLVVRALVYKLPQEPGSTEEHLMREALRLTRAMLHTSSGAFAIDAQERELHFVSALPLGMPPSEALPILRQVGSMLAQWRSHVLHAS